MTDEQILQAAHEELCKLNAPKLWMTERGLARRIHRNTTLEGVTQVRLRKVLMEHAALGPGRRIIRNSPYPSAKTLEVLWGAIRADNGVGERDVPPPIHDRGMLRMEAPEGEGRSEEEESVPTHFLSYNFGDSDDAVAAAEVLEAKGHSIWIAGARIVDEEHINDAVIGAMRSVANHLIYLSANALQSLWVGKEALLGDNLSLKQTIIAKGDDPDLMQLVRDWMDGKQAADSARIAQYEGVSFLAAWKFKELLKTHLQTPEEVIYLSPGADADAHPRLRPLSEFPTAPSNA